MLLVVMTRENCVEMCSMGPHLRQAHKGEATQPLYCLRCCCHRQSHSFSPSGSSGSKKGWDQVFWWVGMEERGKPLRSARVWQHERPYSSQEQSRRMGVCGLLGEKVTGWGYTGYRQSPKIQRLQIWWDSHTQQGKEVDAANVEGSQWLAYWAC